MQSLQMGEMLPVTKFPGDEKGTQKGSQDKGTDTGAGLGGGDIPAVTPKPENTTTSGADDGPFFNGKDLSEWTARKHPGAKNLWSVGAPKVDPKNPKNLVATPGGDAMVNTPTGYSKSLDFYSRKKHGDGIIELEVMIPRDSNSGIFLQGEYEIQVFDSYGRKKLGATDMGAIFLTRPPMLNACGKPGEWQTFEIHFRAPKFDDKGRKTANARIEKILLNGDLIQENVELKRPTPGGIDGEEKALGPLMLQGYHGPAAYRNITIKPL